MQRNMPVCAGRRRAAAEPGPGGRDIAPAAMRPARTSPGAPSRDDGLCKKSRTVTTGQRHPRRRSETEGYAAALISSVAAFHGSPDDSAEAAAARVARSRVLDGPGHEGSAVLGEAVPSY